MNNKRPSDSAQRFSLRHRLRNSLRDSLTRFAHAFLRTDEGRDLVVESLRDVFAWHPTLSPRALTAEPEYPELSRAAIVSEKPGGAPPVFITARFRSGSTLLWNLFRHIEGCTAYYEPLNERRWFDPERRGTRIDATHRNVDDYWKEYEGLNRLSRYYREDWTRRALYMDGSAWDPDLLAYIRELVGHAPRQAVLQFNRVDFRLPWLRRMFPEARVLHLYRHPRDQWCSSLPDWTACPPTARMDDFLEHDHYYLTLWAADLKTRFPFLASAEIDHPYRLFYLIWKLSFWYGREHAHYSVSYEALLAQPQRELQRLLDAAHVPSGDVARLAELVHTAPPRWPKYASHEWFRDHEQWAEDQLADFFMATDKHVAARLSESTG